MAFENFSVHNKTEERRAIMARLTGAPGTGLALASFAVADEDEVGEYTANGYIDLAKMTKEQLLEAVRLLVIARTRR